MARLLAKDTRFKRQLAHLDVYEFGVYTGSSLAEMAAEWTRHNLSIRSVWGFDSFVGVPEEQAELKGTIPTTGLKHWNPGAFSAAAAFKTSSFGKVTADIKAFVSRASKAPWFVDRMEFVRGFYNESLTKQLADSVHPAAYIDIDADLYISTKQALTWIFANQEKQGPPSTARGMGR